MKSLLLSTILLCAFSVQSVHARPSFRSIREEAESNSETQAGRNKQYFQSDWGLRVTYPSAWEPVQYEKAGTSSDGLVPYEYARLIPNFMGIGNRKNYILELYVLAWDTGQEMTIDEVQQFVDRETRPRHFEYWFVDEQRTEVAGIPAVTRAFTSMTGYREETWFSQGRYLYTVGYRSLWDHRESNHFFYEEMLASAVVTPVTEVEEAPKETSESTEETATENEVANVTEGDSAMIFTDVPDTHPYAPAIAWAKETGTIGGYPDGTFGPDSTLNRAELVKILQPLHEQIIFVENIAWETTCENQSRFPDVPRDAWFSKPVCFAKFFGLVDGYPDGTFRPERTVIVAEGLKIAYNALDIDTLDSGGAWYSRYYDHALKRGIFHKTLDPSAPLKRKDVVWILWKLSL